MRKIEKEIIKALRANRFVNLSERDRVERNTYILWNSKIFIVLEKIVTFNFCGWKTSTTKGRINALLKTFCGNCGIFQKDYQLYFSDKNGKITEIDETIKYDVSRESCELIADSISGKISA